MGLFDTLDTMPAGQTGIRGLTAEVAAECDAAIHDGRVRVAAITEENEKLVGVVRRYLSSKGFGCTVRKTSDGLYWQVREKRVMSDEHKERLLTALQASREARAAAKAAKVSEPQKNRKAS